MVASLTTAIGTLGPDLLAVGALGIGISASVFGLRKGWSFLKGFIKA